MPFFASVEQGGVATRLAVGALRIEQQCINSHTPVSDLAGKPIGSLLFRFCADQP